MQIRSARLLFLLGFLGSVHADEALPTIWLGPQDSGRVIQDKTFTGYTRIPISDCSPVASLPPDSANRLPDTPEILVADLPADLPLPPPGGFRRDNRESAALPVVFSIHADGSTTQLLPAAWPDFSLPAAPFRLVSDANAAPLLVSPPDNAPVEQWRTDPDLSLQGFWRYSWSDSRVAASVRPGERLLALRETPAYGPGEVNLCRAVNVRSGLTRNKRYYLDRAARKLFLVPPAVNSPEAAPVAFGIATRPGVCMEIQNATNLTLRNVTFAGIRGTALKALHCPGLRLVDCTFAEIGGSSAIELVDCPGLSIEGGSVSDVSERAVQLLAGDRKSLEPGRAQIRNVRFRNIGVIAHTYAPAILLEGCGNTVVGCSFQETPSSAIRLEGNNHSVLSNSFVNCLQRSDDQGVIDIWGDPSYRGNRISSNLFRDVGHSSEEFPAPPALGRCAIRLDDLIGYTQIDGNRFERASQGRFGAIQINGGGHNTITGNSYLECPIAISIQRWNADRWDRTFQEPRTRDILCRQISLEHPAWQTAYPGISFDAIYRAGPGTNLCLDATPTFW